MDIQSQQQYRQGLGSRVDALEAALQSLGRDVTAEKNIRLMAKSLCTSSVPQGLQTVFQAARSVEVAAPAQLPELTRAFIAILRQALTDSLDGPHDEVAESLHTRQHGTPENTRHDALTGLLNRTAFCEAYEHALGLSARSRKPVVLALLEIDRLADIERGHGQPAVELALQCVGAVLASSSRATDLVARWSALQFVLLFPGEDQAGGRRAIEKALSLLQDRLPVLPDGQPLRLTLSAGLRELDLPAPLETAVVQADRFLYLAKSRGGNQVVSAETTLPPRKDNVLVATREDIAGIFKHILEINGFEVVLTRPSSAAALDVLAHGHFRLIILEEGDDGESGYELLRKLRENQHCHRIPMVMLVSNEQAAARALDLGANDYMLKPLSPVVFIARVRHLLTRGVPAARPQHKLLLVDGDLAALIVAGTALHQSGSFRIRFARTGADALRRAMEVAPDAVCAAARLPDMSGSELLLRLQSVLQPARAAGVLTAPVDQAADVARLSSTTLRGVLTTPFNLQTLAGELTRLLQIKANPAPPSAEDHLSFNSELQRLLSAVASD